MSNPALNTTTAEARAKLVRATKDRLDAGDVLIRRWDNLDATAADGLLAALKAGSLYVTDPQADGREYSGEFVRVDVRAENTDTRWVTIIETLQKVATTIPEAQARLVSASGERQTYGDKLVRQWLYLKPTELQSLAESVSEGDIVSGPSADGSGYTGDYVISNVQTSLSENQRTGTLTEELTRVGSALDAEPDLVSKDNERLTYGDKLVRRWPFLKIDGLQTLAEGTDVGEIVDDPSADGETFPGEYVVSDSRAEVEPDARWGAVRQTLTKVDPDMADGDARLVSTDAERLSYGDTLTREWRYVKLSAMPNDGDEGGIVGDPVADGVTYGGDHVVSEYQTGISEDGCWGIVRQTLIKVAETLADPRYVSEQWDELRTGHVLVREFKYLKLSVMSSLSDPGGILINGPEADGVAYAGNYVISSVDSAETKHYGIIRQTLSAVNVNGALPTGVELAKEEVLRQYDYEEGEMAAVVYEYYHLHPEQQSTYIALDGPSPSASYEVKEKRWRIEEDRTGTLSVLWTKATWEGGASADLVESVSGLDTETDHNVERTKIYPGIPIEEVQSRLDSLRTTDDADAYHVTSARIVNRRNGGADIKQDRAYAYTTDSAFILEVDYDDDGVTVIGGSRFWPNLTPSAANSKITDLDDDANFTLLGASINTSRITRRVDERTGLVTVIQSGLATNNLDSKILPSRRPTRLLDQDYAEQYFIMDLNGDRWRVTVSHLVTASRSTANARLNSSTYNTQNDDDQPILQRQAGATGKTFGRLVYLPNIGKWKATGVKFEKAESAFGDVV